jgi:hypothetical protein
MSQATRLAEYVQENKDIQSLVAGWTTQECCDYHDEWGTYVAVGGVRPRRPHA